MEVRLVRKVVRLPVPVVCLRTPLVTVLYRNPNMSIPRIHTREIRIIGKSLNAVDLDSKNLDFRPPLAAAVEAPFVRILLATVVRKRKNAKKSRAVEPERTPLSLRVVVSTSLHQRRRDG